MKQLRIRWITQWLKACCAFILDWNDTVYLGEKSHFNGVVFDWFHLFLGVQCSDICEFVSSYYVEWDFA